MTIILIFGAAVGAILGFRHFKVLALAPLIVFGVAGIVAVGIATGVDPHNIIICLLAAVACPQIGYLMGSIRPSITPRQPRSDRKSRFTIGSQRQDLLLSNYNNFTHNRTAYPVSKDSSELPQKRGGDRGPIGVQRWAQSIAP